MTYLKEKKVSKRALAMLLSLLMVFSMFSMLTSFVGQAAEVLYLFNYPSIGTGDNQMSVNCSNNNAENAYEMYHNNSWGFRQHGSTVTSVNYNNYGDYYVVVNAKASVDGAEIGISLQSNQGGNTRNQAKYAALTTDYTDVVVAQVKDFNPKQQNNLSIVVDNERAANTSKPHFFIRQIYLTDTPPSSGPSAPENVKATANGQNVIELSWDAVDGAAKYQIFRNGSSEAVAEVTETSYTDTDLTADTTYTYTVKALDADGNASNASKAASAKTDAVPAPVISVVELNGVTADAGKDFTVKAAVSNIGTADAAEGVTVSIVFNGVTKSADIAAAELTVGAKTEVEATFTAPANAADQAQYDVTASAADSKKTAKVTVNAAALALSVNNAAAQANADAELEIVVKNNGHLAYEGGGKVSLVFNGAAPVELDLPAVSAGSQATLKTTVTAPKFNGEYPIVASMGDIKASGTLTVTGGVVPDGYDVVALADGVDTVNLAWTAQAGATGYKVLRSDSADGEYTEIADVTENAYSDTTCSPATTYFYKIKSYKVSEIAGKEIFTIRAEKYGANSDGKFVYEDTDSQLRFKAYSSVSKETTPEAYWYWDGKFLRNYKTNNYATMGSTTVSKNSGSGSYDTNPVNVYGSAAPGGSNSEWAWTSFACDSGSNKEADKTAYVIYLAATSATDGNCKQMNHGRQQNSEPAQLAVSVKSGTTGSCGRHWKIENNTTLPGGTETTDGKLSNPASATTDVADQPILIVNSVISATANAGSAFTVTAEIVNIGLEDQTEPFEVTFTLGGQTATVTVTDSIPAGGSLNVSASDLIAPADAADQSAYTVTAAAALSKKNGTLTVNAPKIVVSSVADAEAIAEAPVEFAITLKNDGHMDYAGGDSVSVVFNNGTAQLVTIPAIAAGGEATVYATDTAPAQNGEYTVTASVNGSSKSGTVTVTGGADPDDEDPYPDTPTKDPTTAPDFSVDYAVFVSGPYFIRNNYTDFGYQYLYDSLDNNNYAGKEDGNNGSDNSSYADYGRLRRQITVNDVINDIQDNQNYMWNIYSKTVGGTTYYMLRNVATGRYMHTGAYTDYYSYNNDNNSANVYAWNAALTNGANGFNGNSNANREMSYYAFTLPSYNNTKGESFTSQIVNQRFAWGQRPLHGELNGDHNTAERRERVFFTSNNEGWGTKNWYFNPANVATTVADLTVTNASADPAEVPFGESMNVSATIKNEGNADIAEGTAILVKFVFNGKLATATYTGGLAAGASADVSASIKPNKLTDGAAMTVTVNADWSIDESDFTNNTYSVENIVVMDSNVPVITVESVEAASADTGAEFTAKAIIKNIGGEAQTEPFDVTFTVGASEQTVTVNQAVEPGAAYEVTAALTAPANAEDQSTYDIIASTGKFKKTGILTVNAPKLVITAVSADDAQANTSFEAIATVKNIGHMDFTGSQEITFSYGGLDAYGTVTALAAGESVDVYATFTAGSVNGTYEIKAQINNQEPVAGTVTITGGDDQDTDPSAPAPAIGENYYIIQSVARNYFLYDDGVSDLEGRSYLRWNKTTTDWNAAENTPNMQWQLIEQNGKYVIKNVGTGRIISSNRMEYLGWDGNHYNSIDIISAPETYTERNDLWSLHKVADESETSAIYTVDNDNLASVDVGHMYWSTFLTGTRDGAAIGNPEGNIVTSTQGNDNDYRRFRFVEYNTVPADITVTDVAVSETAIDLDDTVTAAVTIKNIGGTAVEAGSAIKVKAAFNGVIASVIYNGGLGINEEAIVEIPFTPNKLTDGSTLTVTANSDWAVEESDYTNNAFTVDGITVVTPVDAPDMIVSGFEVQDLNNPESGVVTAGKDIKFAVEIANKGTVAAESQIYTVRIYKVDSDLTKTEIAAGEITGETEPGQKWNFDINTDLIMEAGTYTLSAELDPVIGEIKTNNNTKSLGLTVIPQDPDLELTALNAAAKTVGTSECVTLTATVRNNQYSANVDGTVTVNFAVSDGTNVQNYTVTRNDGIAANGTLEFVKELTDVPAGSYTVTAAVSFDGTDRDNANNSKETSFKIANFKNVAIQRTEEYTSFRQFIDVYTTAEDAADIQIVRFKGAYSTYEELAAAYAEEYAANGNSFLNNPEWTAAGTSAELLESYKKYPILNVLNRTWSDTPKTYTDDSNNVYTECGYFSAIDDTDDNSAPVEYTVLMYSASSNMYSVIPVTAKNFDYKTPTITGEVINDAVLGKLIKVTMTAGASGIASATFSRVYGGGAFVHPYAILDYDEAYEETELNADMLERDLNADPSIVEAYISIPADETSLWYALGAVSGSGTHNFANISIPQDYHEVISIYNNIAPHYDADGNAYYPHSFLRFTAMGGKTVKREIIDVSNINLTPSIIRLIERGGSAYWSDAVDITNSALYYIAQNGNYYIRSTDATGKVVYQNFEFTTDICRIDNNAPKVYSASAEAEGEKQYVTAYSYDIGRYLAIYVTDENGVKHYVYSANDEYDTDDDFNAEVTFNETLGGFTLPTVNKYNTLETVKVKAEVTGGKTVTVGFVDFGGREFKQYVYVPAIAKYSISVNPVCYTAPVKNENGKDLYGSAVLIFKQNNGKNADRRIINATALGLDEEAVNAVLSGENTEIWESENVAVNNNTSHVIHANGLYIIRSVSESGAVAFCTADIDYIIEK